MNLKEIRVSKGFSQQNAAKFLGMPLRTYKRYENEKAYKGTIKYNAILGRLKSLEKVSEKKAPKNYPEVTIIGAGFVGYNTGKVLSRKCNVSFVDINKDLVVSINKEDFAKAYTDINEVKKLDIVIICLPTNLDKKTKKFDTKAIEETLSKIYSLNKYAAVIIKSTVSVGYTSKVIKEFGHNIAFMPEFLREQSALQDSLNPTRLIIGLDSESERIRNFAKCMEKCIDIPRKTIFMSTREAEATKLFSNAYLATRVAFFNELDSFAYEQEIDSKKIIKGMGLDPRIGDEYNHPSFCYSGYCLPKDTNNLLTQTKSRLLDGVVKSNEDRKDFIVKNIIRIAFEKSANPVIGFYNLDLTNKRPNSMREIFDKIQKYPVKCMVFSKNSKENNSEFLNFCKKSNIIISNTYDDKLETVKSKVFTRDVLSR